MKNKTYEITMTNGEKYQFNDSLYPMLKLLNNGELPFVKLIYIKALDVFINPIFVLSIRPVS